MNNDAGTTWARLSSRYHPVAVYYEEADSVEYIRQDVTCVYHRVDEFLTLALDFGNRDPIGFRLKGFKNFYLHHIKPTNAALDNDHFLSLVRVIEKLVETIGDSVFDDENRRAAYKTAYEIAKTDGVQLELSDAA